jgi:hypothetical protein
LRLCNNGPAFQEQLVQEHAARQQVLEQQVLEQQLEQQQGHRTAREVAGFHQVGLFETVARLKRRWRRRI